MLQDDNTELPILENSAREEEESGDAGPGSSTEDSPAKQRSPEALGWALDAMGSVAEGGLEEAEGAAAAAGDSALVRSPSRALPALPSHTPHRTGALLAVNSFGPCSSSVSQHELCVELTNGAVAAAHEAALAACAEDGAWLPLLPVNAHGADLQTPGL